MDGPVFVIGVPRSGTTMLRLALTSHSNICIPPESPFLISLRGRFGSTVTFDRESANDFVKALDQGAASLSQRWGIDPAELVDIDDLVGSSYAQACELLYANYARRQEPGANMWGDKNNPFRHHIRALSSMYPEATFVHLVRDGRALLASAQELASKGSKSQYFPNLPVDAVHAAAEWTHDIEHISNDLSRYAQSRSIQVRYEDLVSDFETEMSRVCDLLGIVYEEGMRDFDAKNRSESLEPREYDDWKWRTRDPLTEERTSSWKSSLPSGDQEHYSALAAATLHRLGYEGSSSSLAESAAVTLGDRVQFNLRLGRLRALAIARVAKSRYQLRR